MSTDRLYIGDAMAASLVGTLAQDCAVAAELAAAVDRRRGGIMDYSAVACLPRASIDRVIADFERRGWLVRIGPTWRIPFDSMPADAPAFLAAMAAMERPAAATEAAMTAVTLPPPPSAIAAALPLTRLSYASLISTEDAMMLVATSAVQHLTIVSPFLNRGGFAFAKHLLLSSPATLRSLIVRDNGAARSLIDNGRDWLEVPGIRTLNCLLPNEEGYETVHAKVILADDQLAYVGSANMLTHRIRSLELGNIVRGHAAKVVASVVQAIEQASLPWIWGRTP